MPNNELKRLRARLADAEATIAALRCGEVDAIVGEQSVLLLRLRETEEALRQQSKALERNQMLLDAVLEAMPAGLVIADARGRIVRDNAATRELWGVLPETDSWEDYREWIGWWPETGQRIKTEEWAMTRALMHGTVTRNELIQNQKFHSDERRYYLNNVAPIRDGDGQIVGAVATMLDVTDQIAVQEALRKTKEELEQRVAERTAQLQLLSDAATAANEAEQLDDAIYYVLRRVSEYNGWAFGHAYLADPDDCDILVPVKTYYEEVPQRYERFRAATRELRLRRGQGLPGRVYASGQPGWSTDLPGDLIERRARLSEDVGLVCAAAFPIRSGRKVVGVLEFLADHAIEPSERIIDTMNAAGTQLGRVFERDQFHHQISSALLGQQRSIASSLHDTVSQQLAGAALSLEGVARRLEADHRPEGPSLRRLVELLHEAQQNVRDTARGLFPVSGEAGALSAALGDLADSIEERHDVACGFESAGLLDPPDPAVAAHLYFIVKEAVTNAVRHARCGRISISARREAHRLRMEVCDDGTGIPEAVWDRGGAGLRIMRYRATLIGAELEVLPAPGGGTRVRCTLGLEQGHEQA